ncbi:hypothetical protein IQ273_15530 [Nodosilinea sp. LEGE 07298]|uniref:hypothetical protein n=1 Tax=Nodosilinea sp. LEGE 07298 TaxID=2777970 RepID=UPI001880E021|nr:hypothetical protein [Nodosilinea sp. LEGE 07298]MBE9110824.1 hypothetical protein [Nodosilinea sp. LEGE 07298]
MFNLVYWMDDVSGNLAPVVEKFLLTEEHLDDTERATLAEYLRNWAYGPFAGGSNLEFLQAKFTELVAQGDRNSIEQWCLQALDLGIEPF